MQTVETKKPDLSAILGQLGETMTAGLEERMLAIESGMIETVAKLTKEVEDKKPAVLTVKYKDVERKLKSKAVPWLERGIQITSGMGENLMLVGPSGCGKTIGAQQLADALGLPFTSICCSAGMSETWIFGRPMPKEFIEAGFCKSYEFGGVHLFDEYDASDSNTQLSINTALANGVMFNPMNGQTVKRHKDFICVAGANTVGKGSDFVYTGRNRLDGASLERFVMIKVDYDSSYEEIICPDKVIFQALTATRKKLNEESLEEILSTRMFIRFQKMHDAKFKMSEIIESLTLSWSDEARTILKTELKNAKKGTQDAI